MDRIVMYLRLSKEDDLIRDESNSISNQRDLIKNYIRKDKKLRKMEVLELKDDGYTGKNMNRPGMQELLEMARKQQVSCIIVKDMSRFSRDHLVIGRYTEQIFPFMGIRFIAINDSYDSDDYEGGLGEIDVAFKALLYDFYSEDLSEKVKSALLVRKEQGHFMNVYAPYGYRKSEKDHHVLEIEPLGAAVIRRIFSDYDSGKSMFQIAVDLNNESIPSPKEYICRRDRRDYFRSGVNDQTAWTTSSVSRILHNEIYAGTAVYHKAHNRSVGAGGGVYYPEAEWKRLENHHPALIEKELFERVRAKVMKNKKAACQCERHVLQGLIVCGNCGRRMAHSWKPGRPKYYCQYRHAIGNPEDCIRSIRDEDLEFILTDLIRGRIRNQIDMADVLTKETEKHREKVNGAKSRLREMRASYEKIDADLFRAYESYREGLTDKETYLQLRDSYEQMLEQLQGNLNRQQEAIDRIESESQLPDGWIPNSRYLQIKKLDRTLAELLIQKVVVYADHTIEVVWNLKNEE